MIKKLLPLALMAMCFSVFATSTMNNIAPAFNKQHSASEQWGLDAINIPQQVTIHSAESLGLILPNNSLDSNKNTLISSENHWLNKTDSAKTFRFSTIQTTSLNSNISSLNAGYSNGKFSAESALITHSNNLLTSSQFYLQGSYSLIDGEYFNVSLTAKIEALDAKSISNYYGKENNLTNDNSIFNQPATNTSVGIVTTYAINKNWKVLGIISSVSLDNKIENSPLIDNNNLHMALIGTSYSF